MKKLFTVAIAVLASLSLFAAEEVTKNEGASNADIKGNSFTISGTYVAGKGGTQVDPMPNKGIKVRLNKEVGSLANAFQVTVNEDCKITAIEFIAVTNTDNQGGKLSKVFVDDVEVAGFEAKDLPAKNASKALDVTINSINATKSIVFQFTDLGEAIQANACFKITYEDNAVKFPVTYKANYGEVKDVNDAAAKEVSDNPFKLPEDQYFVGWNTKADGTGTPYKAGDKVTEELTLYAQWKSFTTCLRLTIAAQGETPAQGGEVALRLGSNTGGKIIFADAKSADFSNDYTYKPTGLQLGGGGKDSLRVTLDEALAEGAVLRLILVANKDGKPMINIVASGKTTMLASNIDVTNGDTVSVYHVVGTDDGLKDVKVFNLQRNDGVVLRTLAIQKNASCEAAPAPFSENNALKVLKINNDTVKSKEGIFAYEVPEDYVGLDIDVVYELVDANAKGDKESPFLLAVPKKDAKTNAALVVTAQDGTLKSYNIELTSKVDPRPKSNDASVNWLKINGAAIAADNKVYAYTVAAAENLAQVEVTYELAAGAKGDPASGFKVDVPASSTEAAKEAKLTVTAEDGTTKAEYTIKVSRAAADAPKSTDATIKELKINNEAVAEKDGVFAYEVAAEESLAEVSVVFVLNESHAKADKDNPFKVAVPEAGAAAKEETINVTAEDGTTKKAYKVSITKAKKEEAIDNTVVNTKAVKMIENGRLVILKNGVKYDVTGAELR